MKQYVVGTVERHENYIFYLQSIVKRCLYFIFGIIIGLRYQFGRKWRKNFKFFIWRSLTAMLRRHEKKKSIFHADALEQLRTEAVGSTWDFFFHVICVKHGQGVATISVGKVIYRLTCFIWRPLMKISYTSHVSFLRTGSVKRIETWRNVSPLFNKIWIMNELNGDYILPLLIGIYLKSNG